MFTDHDDVPPMTADYIRTVSGEDDIHKIPLNDINELLDIVEGDEDGDFFDDMERLEQMAQDVAYQNVWG